MSVATCFELYVSKREAKRDFLALRCLVWVGRLAIRGLPEVEACVYRIVGFQREGLNAGHSCWKLVETGTRHGYYVLAGAEDRATQACDPSAAPVATQREGPPSPPGLSPSRWQPSKR